MELQNYTPFPSLVWENANSSDDWYVTFISKVKLDIKTKKDSEQLYLQLSSNQGELNLSEVFYGKADESSVKYDSDLITYKKNSDVIINANSYSYYEEKKSWQCGVKIFDPNNNLIKDYFLNVKGKKELMKLGLIWIPSLREKASEVPLIYEKSYGGTIRNKDEKVIKMYPYNPVGCGIKKIADINDTTYAPQISHANKLFTKAPAGFGFIGKTWKSRLKYIGTYDDNWVKNKHPYLPDDFDYMYYQAANPELIMDGYLEAGTIIELYNLTKNSNLAYFKVPNFELVARLKFHIGETFQKMNLDTLIIDINDEDEAKHCIYASYRARIKKIQEIETTQIMLLKNEVKNG